MPLSREERLDAKIRNEHTRLFANLVNGIAGGVVLGGFITPVVVARQLDLWWGGFSIGGATILHMVARVILFDLKPEE